MLEFIEWVLWGVMCFMLGVWLDFKTKQQKPKKPVETEEFTDGGWIGKCPCCGSDCNDVMNYCDQCGQKLDWSEV